MGLLYHLRQHFLYASYDDIVGNGIDGSVRVSIDGYDDATLLHAYGMLYLSADAAGDIEFGTYGESCLPYHAVVLYEACIYGSAACAYLSVQLFGKVEEQVEVLS